MHPRPGQRPGHGHHKDPVVQILWPALFAQLRGIHKVELREEAIAKYKGEWLLGRTTVGSGPGGSPPWGIGPVPPRFSRFDAAINRPSRIS